MLCNVILSKAACGRVEESPRRSDVPLTNVPPAKHFLNAFQCHPGQGLEQRDGFCRSTYVEQENRPCRSLAASRNLFPLVPLWYLPKASFSRQPIHLFCYPCRQIHSHLLLLLSRLSHAPYTARCSGYCSFPGRSDLFYRVMFLLLLRLLTFGFVFLFVFLFVFEFEFRPQLAAICRKLPQQYLSCFRKKKRTVR